MQSHKKCLLILILTVVFGASAGWGWLFQSNFASAATPTPAPTAASDDISFTLTRRPLDTIVNATAGSLDLNSRMARPLIFFHPARSTLSPGRRTAAACGRRPTGFQPAGGTVSPTALLKSGRYR
jgi:hypothetical protein